MAVTLPDAHQLSDEVLEALRLRALRAFEMDSKEAQIAEILGVSGRRFRAGSAPMPKAAWTRCPMSGPDALSALAVP